MNVYLWEAAGALHAITEKGERLGTTPASPGVKAMDEAARQEVLAFRDQILRAHPEYRMKVLWVSDVAAHGGLKRLLELEAAAQRQEETLVTHLCLSCAHACVCVGCHTAQQIGFMITACPEHTIEEPEQ